MITVERIIPSETPPGVLALHLKRYEFARTYLTGMQVLDLGCGVGYGARYLAGVAGEVVGVDIDIGAIEYAQKRYTGPRNLAFVNADANRLGLQTSCIDVVCSFETIEHVINVDAYLKEVKRVLNPGGVFIVSTPCVRSTTSSPENIYHVQEWCPADFERLLNYHFRHVDVFGQSRFQTSVSMWLKRLDIFNLRVRIIPLWLTRGVAHLAGVRATPDTELDDVFIKLDDFSEATEIVAVAHN